MKLFNFVWIIRNYKGTLSPSKNIHMKNKGAWHLAGTYENKNTKISSEGLRAIYMKICTYQISHHIVYAAC